VFDDTGNSFAGEAAAFSNAGVAITATSTFCGYLVFDVASGAPDGDTAEFQITASGDITDSGASTITGVPAVMGGVTTLQGINVTQIHYRWRNDDGSQGDPP